MATSVSWDPTGFGTIRVPRADMTLVQPSPEVRSIDVNTLRGDVGALFASIEGGPYVIPFIHNGEIIIAGVTYARSIQFLYAVEFEDGQYEVRPFGGNHNLLDVHVINQVSISSNNSAGLIRATTAETAAAVWDEPVASHVVSGSMGDQQRRAAFLEGDVHIDLNGIGAPGTAFPLGTYDHPSNNITDARAIADANGITKYHVRGSIVLDAAHANWTFIGDGGGGASIDPGGFTTSASTFRGVQVTGTLKGGNMTFLDCDLINVADLGGEMLRCGLSGTIAMDTGQSTFEQCYSLVPGVATPILDIVGPGRSVGVRSYSGGLELRNMTSAGNLVTVELIGHAIVAASCTAGTLVLRGIAELDDNSVGTTLDTVALLDPLKVEEVWLMKALNSLLPYFNSPSQIIVGGITIDIVESPPGTFTATRQP